jgi:glucan-binding YG repeat protein
MKHRALPSSRPLVAAFIAAIIAAAALPSLWAPSAFAEDTQPGTADAAVVAAAEGDAATSMSASLASNSDAATNESDESLKPAANDSDDNGNSSNEPASSSIDPSTTASETGAIENMEGPNSGEGVVNPGVASDDDANTASPSTDSREDQSDNQGDGAEAEGGSHEPGLVTDGGATRYLQADGTYFSGGWKTVGGKTYYFGESGYALRYSQWIDGKLYYFKKDGSRHTGWVNWYAGGRSYFSPKAGHNGAAAKGWWTIGGERYYFDADDKYRRAATYSTRIGDRLYYFNAKGQRYEGWVNWYAGGKSYFSPRHSGAAAKGWWTIGGERYYFDAGDKYRRAVRSTQEISGKTYYFNSRGQMFNDGWLRWKADGKWSYFGSNGARYYGEHTINGVTYNFGTSGKVAVNPVQSKMAKSVQSYRSNTNRLIMIDVTNNYLGVFKGSKGNWNLYKYWICSSGKPSTPTVLGQYTVTGKGYSFGHGYTCYYYTQFYGDYLIHSVKFHQGTFNVLDGRMGMHISEGCIRLPLDRAKWIYNNIPYGTKVVIYR